MSSTKKTPFLDSPWFPRFKDISIFLGWIGGLILIGCLCWFLSAPLRDRLLMKAVNRVLTLAGDPRRLDAPIPFKELEPAGSRLGAWYTLIRDRDGRQDGRALVFTIAAEGTFFPCAAEIDSLGKVAEIIPLSRHGEKMLKRLPPGILQIYIRRIEGSGGNS
jgi:hypothetical protein